MKMKINAHVHELFTKKVCLELFVPILLLKLEQHLLSIFFFALFPSFNIFHHQCPIDVYSHQIEFL